MDRWQIMPALVSAIRFSSPFDAAIGKKITDNLVVSLEGGAPIVKDYPVYDFKTKLKVTWSF
jgi:hypothetical protein